MDFYERAKELAEKQNLSLISLLESLDINYETYKSAKRMNNLPRANEAVKIAQALHTTVEYLVTGEESDERRQLTELKAKILDFAKSVQ